MTLSTGTKLGSYEITGAIGAGGMGEVYRARDAKLGRDVQHLLRLPFERLWPPHISRALFSAGDGIQCGYLLPFRTARRSAARVCSANIELRPAQTK